MALDRYAALPMLVELAEPCAAPHYFALTGPKDWRPELARKIFHETLHYWQHISQGFLIRLIEEDYRRLQAFEETGKVPAPGNVKKTFMARSNEAGFSARDLMESHARYWDMHGIGPPRLIEADLKNPDKDTDPVLTRDAYEDLKAKGQIWQHIDEKGEGRGYSGLSFDLAMRLAGDSYAKPYLQLREATNTHTAGVLFPLVVHCAMQSDDPVAAYGRLIHRFDVLPVPDQPPPIESEWRRHYPMVLKVALKDAVEVTGAEFPPGRHVIDQSGLARHPGYHLAAALMAFANKHLCDHRTKWLLFADTGMPETQRADWTIDFLLACAGMPATREPELLCYFSPPWVRFGDGTDWCPGEDFDRLLPFMPVAPDLGPVPGLRGQYPAYLKELEDRWAALQRASVLSVSAAA